MKRKLLVMGLLAGFLTAAIFQTAVGEENDRLLEAFKKLETSIKALADKNSAEKSQKQATPTPAHPDQAVKRGQRIKTIQTEISSLKKSLLKSEISGSEIVDIVSEIQLLQAELAQLQAAPNQNGPQLASLQSAGLEFPILSDGSPLDGRARLEEHGVIFELGYTGEMASNTSGGLSQRTEYLENGDVTLSIDAETLMNWKGASFSFYLLGDRGGSASEMVGDMQGVSNIEADDTWKLYEAWYQQNFAQDKLSLLVGLFDLNSEFDAIENAGLFLNSSFGIGPDYSQSGQNGPSIFPTTSVAFRARFQPSEAFYVQSAVFDGVPGDPDDPTGTEIHFGNGDGILIATEAGYLTGTEEDSEAAYSKYAVGSWVYSARFDDISDVDNLGDPIKRSGNSGFYILGEQTVYREQDHSQGLALFARLGFANTKINQIGSYFGGGLVYSGLLPGRNEDQIGLAVAAAVNGSKFKTAMSDLGTPVESAEVIIEFSYNFQVLPQLAIHPDLQYVINPGTDPGVKNALLMGTRFELSF